MATIGELVKKLGAAARPDQIEGMARFGMDINKRLGIGVPFLRRLARETGKDHRLALLLWQTGIAEARILASMVDDPAQVTEAQMEEWVLGINSWDICDQVCMNLFDKTPLAWTKVSEWAEREEEYVKRAAFSLAACIAWHDKAASDERLASLLPVIITGASDDRNFVRKAVNWALRTIGKRNRTLNRAALKAAREIQQLDSKAARWVAADAIRELESEAVQERLKG